MRCELSTTGLTVASDDERVAFGPALPAGRLTVAGRQHDWLPGRLTATDGAWVAEVGSSGVRVEVQASPVGDAIIVRARVVNAGRAVATLERLTLLRTDSLRIGDDATRWRIYRNGYQSWSGTWTIGVDESDVDLPTRFARVGATDGRHRAATGTGHIRSDSMSVIAEPDSGDALGVAFLTLADAFCFIEVDAPHGKVRSFELWVDLDGIELPPGEATPWFTAHLVATSDASGQSADDEPTTAGTRALRAVAEASGNAMGARRGDGHHPSGWCSWYYYFTKVNERDVDTNLAVLAADGPGGPRFRCDYVMIDDGHQAAIGDWLTTNDKFPSGMAAVAGRIRDAGFDAGIWWAPFIVSAKSRVAAEHPDWLVRGRRGRPIVGLVNPGWGITTPMWVLDTTNPATLDHIREVARVIGHDWGYHIQKIDFCYAAALPGVRHDRAATRAWALRHGLEAVRAGAGPDGFVLGCGSPLGPAVGVVDAMRIGADVTPSWTTLIGRTAGRNRHALATAHALLNTLTRSALDGAWFLNDPDCLMVRDTDTKLTEAEVQLMCTIYGMTDGMVVLSDRLDRLPESRQALVTRTHELVGGRPEVADLFDRDHPRVLISRHRDRVDVAALNLDDRSCPGPIDLARLGLRGTVDTARRREFWTGAPIEDRGDSIDFGVIPSHSARVAQLPRLDATA